MNYNVIIEKIKYWKEYNWINKNDDYRKTHDLDCILTGGDLNADTIFSLWLPLRYALNYVGADKWNEWITKVPSGIKQNQEFMDDLINNIEYYLPEKDLEELNICKLFELGNTRANIMILPYRQWNNERGCAPYWEYMPHFLYDKLNTKNIDFLNAEKKWILDEHLDVFFIDGKIDKDNLLDLAGSGRPTSHHPIFLIKNLKTLLNSYISILEKRSKYY